MSTSIGKAMLGLLAGAAVGTSQATAVYLYDEAVNGDLPTYLTAGGAPPVFALGAGLSVVTGSWSGYLPPQGAGNMMVDTDAFLFTVASGHQVVDIQVQYNFSATRGGTSISAVHYLMPDPSDFTTAIYESVSTSNNPNGAPHLFDAAGFAPLGASASPRQLWLGFGGGSLPYDVSFVYDYTMILSVEPVAAAAVPEPGTLALAGAAFAALAALRRRRASA